MSDKSAKSGEDMLQVLADDLGRYELLSAKEYDELLRDVEGHHPDLPISLNSEQEEDGSDSVSDVTSYSTASERFVPVTPKD